QVDVHPIDSSQLGQSHPRRVEQLEDRAVSYVGEFSFLRLQLGRLKQQLDLGTIEIARQVFVLLQSFDGARRIGIDQLVAMQIPVETPHGRKGARDRPLVEL